MNTEHIAKWAVELSQIEDRIVASQGELRDQLKDGRKEISFLRERAKRLLGLISGREHEQLALPGAEPAAETTVHIHVPTDVDAIRGIVDSSRFRDALRKERQPRKLGFYSGNMNGKPCAIPGCTQPGKRTKGTPGLWCADHGAKLSAAEKKSIDARNKRLGLPKKPAASGKKKPGKK